MNDDIKFAMFIVLCIVVGAIVGIVMWEVFIDNNNCPAVTQSVKVVEKPVYLESECPQCPNCISELINKADEVRILEDYLNKDV